MASTRLRPTSGPVVFRPNVDKRAKHYVPLYDMLCEIVHAIKDDPEADAEMKSLARRGRAVLDAAKRDEFSI